MLQNVHLQNLALIREADIDFGHGLNILTGETGAGKSIIIGSINIALGDKANKSFIRNGADFGLIELRFSTDDTRISSLLNDLGIPSDDGNILVTRRITPEGSVSRINGSTVTLASLKSVTSLLVDIHGQHDHQSLLHSSRHLDIVDASGGEFLRQVREEFHKCYQEYRSLRSDCRQYSQDPEELAKEISFLEFESKEIEDAALKPGEDTALEAEYKKLAGAERINDSLRKISLGLFDQDDSASARIADGLKEIQYLQSQDPDLKVFGDYLMDLDSLFRDMNHELSRYLDTNTFQEERFIEVRRRLDEISRLKSKYGHSLEEILTYQQKLTERLASLRDYSAHREELLAQMKVMKARVNQYAQQLSEKRKETALILEEQIRNNLKDLNFLDVDFQIHFEKADKIYENGFDKVEFLISTNPGEPARPLARIASGGELSRIMLAIKSSSAEADRIETLIFDEIDAGISGRTAHKVAEKLALLSRDHQLICITHLPQIAGMADTHFSIEKSVSEGSTISGIRKLEREDSILELARLLSGNEITETTLKNAEEIKMPAASWLDQLQ